MSLFSAISPEDMQAADIITGVAFAAFIGVGFAPGLRPYARTIRLWLVLLFLLACSVLLVKVLMRADSVTTGQWQHVFVDCHCFRIDTRQLIEPKSQNGFILTGNRPVEELAVGKVAQARRVLILDSWYVGGPWFVRRSLMLPGPEREAQRLL